LKSVAEFGSKILMSNGDSVDILHFDAEALAERLRIAREKTGLSQPEFADRIGYSRRQVSAWEAGANPPPITVLLALRRLCDVDPEWILSGPGDEPLHDVGPELRSREKHIRIEIEKMVRDAGMILPEESIAELMSLLRIAPPSAERAAKVHIRKLLMQMSMQKA